jgi:hypothetical protein
MIKLILVLILVNGTLRLSSNSQLIKKVMDVAVFDINIFILIKINTYIKIKYILF